MSLLSKWILTSAVTGIVTACSWPNTDELTKLYQERVVRINQLKVETWAKLNADWYNMVWSEKECWNIFVRKLPDWNYVLREIDFIPKDEPATPNPEDIDSLQFGYVQTTPGYAYDPNMQSVITYSVERTYGHSIKFYCEDFTTDSLVKRSRWGSLERSDPVWDEFISKMKK